jgi:hypothetical protein
MDLGPVIQLLAFDQLIVTRRTSSYNAHGVLVLSAPTTLTINANVQPLGAAIGQGAGGRASLAGTAGKNLELSVLGQRLHGAIVAYTQDQLMVSTQPGQTSDEVLWNGDLYDVVHSEQWGTENYWRSVLVKREV